MWTDLTVGILEEFLAVAVPQPDAWMGDGFQVIDNGEKNRRRRRKPKMTVCLGCGRTIEQEASNAGRVWLYCPTSWSECRNAARRAAFKKKEPSTTVCTCTRCGKQTEYVKQPKAHPRKYCGGACAGLAWEDMRRARRAARHVEAA